MKKTYFWIFLLFHIALIAQNTSSISIYKEPNTTGNDTLNKVENNKDFKVRIVGDWEKPKPNLPWKNQIKKLKWKDLFEYTTFVDFSEKRWDPVNKKAYVKKSSFVTFGINGTQNKKVYLEIAANNVKKINNYKIRPLSRKFESFINNNKLYVAINGPQKLTIEINGDRYKNLHVFANGPSPAKPKNATKVFKAGTVSPLNKIEQNCYYKKVIKSFTVKSKRERDAYIKKFENTKNDKGYKLEISPLKNGLFKIEKYLQKTKILTKYTYEAKDNDIIYFEPGAIVKGSIFIGNKKNVKILGHGIIDMVFAKQLHEATTLQFGECEYEYMPGIEIYRSNNIDVNDIIINNAQQFQIRIVTSHDIRINNVKIFSQNLWGDGIDIASSHNIDINDCFIRTSDDCIAIYGTKIRPWGYLVGDTYNINTKNCILWSDGARPIAMGFHGNQKTQNKEHKVYNGDFITNLTFENIDILEHDSSPEILGVFSINSGDENTFSNIRFKNIRIEDFTKGSLFQIRIEKGYPTSQNQKDGIAIRNVFFEDIIYNHKEKDRSEIKGLSENRNINGIYFNNVKINGKTLNNSSRFDKNGFEKNIKFQESPCDILPNQNDITFTTDIDNDNIDELIILNTNYCSKKSTLKIEKINTGKTLTPFAKGITYGFTDPNDISLLADVDNDGIKDLVLINTDNPDVSGGNNKSKDVLVLKLTTGEIISYIDNHVFGGTLDGWLDKNNIRPFVGDADDDGDEDLFFINTSYTGGAIKAIDLKTGQSVFEMPHETFEGWFDPEDEIFIGNFHEARGNELLLVNKNQTEGGAIRVLNLLNKQSVFCSEYTKGNCNDTASGTYKNWLDTNDKLYVSDIDGDNLKDLIFINTDYRGNAVRVMKLNDGANISLIPNGSFDGWLDSNDKIFFGDTNGNGKKEMILINSSGKTGSAIRVLDLFEKQSIFCSDYKEGECKNLSSNTYDGWLDNNDKVLIGNFKEKGNTDLLLINTYYSGSALRVMDLKTGHSYFSKKHGTFNNWFDGIDKNSIIHDSSFKRSIKSKSLRKMEIKRHVNYLELYPNPSSKNIHINLPERAKCKIYTILGNEIYKKNLKKGINKINTSNLKSGTYLISIKMKNKIFKKKFIKL